MKNIKKTTTWENGYCSCIRRDHKMCNENNNSALRQWKIWRKNKRETTSLLVAIWKCFMISFGTFLAIFRFHFSSNTFRHCVGCVCGVFARFFLPAKCSRMHRLTSPLLVLQLKHDNSRKCRLTIEGNIISSFSVALKIRNRPKFRQLNLPLPQHGPAVHSPSVLKNERPTHFDWTHLMHKCRLRNTM